MVQEKADHVVETEAEYLVGGDMACLMNIGGRLSREGRNVKVVHLAEILNHSLNEGGNLDEYTYRKSFI